MQTQESGFWKWQQTFKNEASCVKHLIKLRWPKGFVCPICQHNHGYNSNKRKHFECAGCHKQSSVTSGTLFLGSKVPLLK